MYWKGEAPLGSPAGAGDSIPKCPPPTCHGGSSPRAGALVLKTHTTSTRAQLARLTGLIADTDTQDAPARLPVNAPAPPLTLSSCLSLPGPAERAGDTYAPVHTHTHANTCPCSHMHTRTYA